MDKITARAFALEKRKKESSSRASSVVIQQILDSKMLENFTDIGIYYPIRNEISILKLMDYYPNKRFYLPKTAEELSFVLYKKDSPLVDGKFHTKELHGDSVCRDRIQCFFIPCVAISKDKKRIGYGKGYYDRYLEGYRGVCIGIGYASCSDLDIECERYDICLNHIFVG